ncbi:MAG: hypothetical protein KAY24_09195, partial [Candidatus Eisenbacteria sp.]|nr:hypothetical protein [Candidatus Eisenbacteria bacterium]
TVRIFVQGIPRRHILDDQTRSRLAREAHERFRRERGKPFIHQDPSLSPWEDLPDTLRQSNLQQIDHIGEKLRLIGYALEPAKGKEIESFEFPLRAKIGGADVDPVEFLAEAEHARWNMERLYGGWVCAEKDVEKKQSPYLVAWTELPEDIRSFDRNAVRNIPSLMRAAGYRIVPLRPRRPRRQR